VKGIIINILFFLSMMGITQKIAQEPVKDLSFGNKWFYHVFVDPFGNPPAENEITFKVMSDTIISNVEFKKVERRLIRSTNDIISYQFENVDSSKLRTIYQCHFWNGDPWTDEISYDFSLEVGDTFYNQPLDPGYYPLFIVDYKGDTLIFNEQLNYMKITTVECRYSAIPFNEIFVAEKFGAVKIREYGSDYLAIHTLKGALIAGVVYGDTIVVSVETLKVYDVLGNEIETLVSEERAAGSFEVKFDATGLPSGIYFYRLQAGSIVETKKMVLMK
jgi:hypothetical protein